MFISNSMRTGSSCFSDTPLLAAGFFIGLCVPTSLVFVLSEIKKRRYELEPVSGKEVEALAKEC